MLVEGNYLLLDQPGWRKMKTHIDFSIGLNVEQDILRLRLTKRWQKHGLSKEDIAIKVDKNDLPNGQIVAESLARVDIVVGDWIKPTISAS